VRRIWQFCQSVLRHWGTLVTGGAIIGGIGIWQGSGNAVNPWVYWTIAIIALVIACFKTWNDQVDIAQKAVAAKDALEWPENRPMISFDSWGQVEGETGSAIFQHGFYVTNHGGPALEVTLERFEIDDQVWATSRTVSQIGAGSQGFCMVWIEEAPVLAKFMLNHYLEKAVVTRLNSNRLHYGEVYEVPVSVIYRDFNMVWYRSKTALRYFHKRDRIEFGPPIQDRAVPPNA
jgi:hypothetical protein